jgi:gliding motility-associated-like protein
VYPLTDTLFSVTVTDSNNCVTLPQSVFIQIFPPLNMQVSSVNEICQDDTTLISTIVFGGNGGPYFYSWNNGSVASELSVFPPADTIYTVTVHDGCNYTAFDSTLLFVDPLPDINFSPQLISGCSPLQVSFTDLSTADPGSAFLWTFGDGYLSTEQQPDHIYLNAGLYSVDLEITSPQGCHKLKSVSDAVDVWGLPVANFSVYEQEISILYPYAIFTNLSQGAINYQWDFGDQSGTSTDINPTYLYNDTGTYLVRLIVENIAGCPDTIFGTLKVLDETSVFIPSAFTPNGDGINDYLVIYAKGFRDYDMRIFNRWGSEIFHSTDIFKSWDGTLNGNFCENNVYVCKISIHDFNGKQKEYIGRITLVR